MVLTSSASGFRAATSSASTINSTNLHSHENMIVNMRVTANSGQGHRKYMEDCYKIRFQRDTTINTDTNNNKNGEKNPQSDILFSYFGIFDGHGGKEAAQYCKEKLFWAIIESDDFWSDNDSKILGAIREGFVKCHLNMWDELPNWPKTASGLPSTSGTTATVLFIKKSKAYVGHVGDSGLVIGYTKTMTSKSNSLNTPWYGKKLTRDHKPEDPIELKRIESLGGSVMSKSGVNRVVWNRPVLSGVSSCSNLQNVSLIFTL
jgi:protein phosphatase 1D